MVRNSEQAIIRFLSILRATEPPQYVSGEVLARRAGVSRSAVWKQVRRLRSYGYGIDSMRGAGYRLARNTQSPVPWELKNRLKTRTLGRDVMYLGSTDSTQSIALSMANKKLRAADGLVVIADRQSSGRGRLGRKWLSPQGGLWFSVLIRPKMATAQVTVLPFVAAIAVREAIVKCTGIEPRLKWPNDIMISGKKVAGILLDISAEAESVNYAVIGVGINANIDASMLAPQVTSLHGITSLRTELGHEVSRLDLVATMLESLEYYLDILAKDGPTEIISAWKKHADMLGRRVEILSNDGPNYDGIAFDLEEDGSLLLMLDTGKKIGITSGDVRVRY
ncbi:MAG TPA: biotin--[acetyl-CoA-carboxylase] ligase [Nitrososphaera sp.]|nr:biotin--[acetyl-CoA-carboxylase] ligase [Nitrososphaera sp.]